MEAHPASCRCKASQLGAARRLLRERDEGFPQWNWSRIDVKFSGSRSRLSLYIAASTTFGEVLSDFGVKERERETGGRAVGTVGNGQSPSQWSPGIPTMNLAILFSRRDEKSRGVWRRIKNKTLITGRGNNSDYRCVQLKE